MSKPYVALAALADETVRAQPEGQRAPLRLLRLDELLEHPFREREPILGDWLLTSGLATIHSWRGVGKTHTALGVAYAAASGGTFLRWTAPKPRRVFYIDGEMPGSSLAQRLAAIVGYSETEADPANFTVLTPDAQTEGMPDLATPEGQSEVDGAIDACDAELIVVDNLSCLVRGGKPENDAESWQPVATWALRHRKHGRTILFIHHSGKNGAQRGTSKREDILDTVIALKRPGDYSPTEGARFEVHFEKHRNDKGDSAKTLRRDWGRTLAEDLSGRCATWRKVAERKCWNEGARDVGDGDRVRAWYPPIDGLPQLQGCAMNGLEQVSHVASPRECDTRQPDRLGATGGATVRRQLPANARRYVIWRATRYCDMNATRRSRDVRQRCDKASSGAATSGEMTTPTASP